MVTTLAAAAIIVMAVLGVGVSLFYFGKALKKAEVTNIVVAVEANLVTAMNNKLNFSDPAKNTALRNGTLSQLSLTTAFGVVTIPIFNAGSPPVSVVGYLDRNFAACTSFSEMCVLKYEVRLQRKFIPNFSIYSYAYKVEANPDVIEMSALGTLENYDLPIDPANYRVEDTLAKCDANDVFMTGINRDTGEAFCATKPSGAPCGDGTLPKGLIFQPFLNQPKAGTVMLDCTSSTMRTFKCPPNYALYKFDPRYADPEFPYGVPGKCVFVTSATAPVPGNYPINPTSPYMKTVSGTFCPPYYKPSGGGCILHPDTSRNSSAAYGKGRCAATKYTATGTAYADEFYDTYPTAVPQVTYSGRDVVCTFVDTSAPCTAPATDISGNSWGKKNSKWYGGVQVSGLACSYDPSASPAAETVDATL